ncbi:MAG: hypothetical protein ABJZ55_22165 [Fuerstiella sp.]
MAPLCSTKHRCPNLNGGLGDESVRGPHLPPEFPLAVLNCLQASVWHEMHGTQGQRLLGGGDPAVVIRQVSALKLTKSIVWDDAPAFSIPPKRLIVEVPQLTEA